MTLGSYPSRRYYKPWTVQRLVNRAPEWSSIRRFHSSIGQQILNPIGIEFQEQYQELERAKKNYFLSSCDLGLLSNLFKLDLAPGMSFQKTEDLSGKIAYTPPSVYAIVNGSEEEITQSEFNNIETLAYDCLPSRIEDSFSSFTYQEIIPETSVSSLSSISPSSVPISGHLFVTLKNNLIWEKRTNKKVFFSKIHITGVTRKGTQTTEVVPLRYNGTFKTINQWKEITGVTASYLSDSATITIESFPFSRESYLDSFNICVNSDFPEKTQFLKFGSNTWGSSFIAESLSYDSFEMARTIGLFDTETNYEIELLDEGDENVNLVDFLQWPNSRFIYAIDNEYLYVYDVNLPYPNAQNIDGESFSPLVDLQSERWVIKRGDSATIKTKDLGSSRVPLKYRLHVLDPDGIEYYLGLDGTLWPTTIDGWIDNIKWGNGGWDDIVVSFEITKNKEWIVTLDCFYSFEDSSEPEILSTKYLFFSPSITPEVKIELPVGLKNSTSIGLSSDKEIFLKKNGLITRLDIFYDYFLVDYERNRVWLKEDYSSVRIVP